MQHDDCITYLGEEERNLFYQKSKEVINKVRDENVAVELTKEDFERIEDGLQGAKDQAIEHNTVRLAKEKEEAEKDAEKQEELAEEERTRMEKEKARLEQEQNLTLIEKDKYEKEKSKAKNASFATGAIVVVGGGIFCATGGARSTINLAKSMCK